MDGATVRINVPDGSKVAVAILVEDTIEDVTATEVGGVMVYIEPVELGIVAIDEGICAPNADAAIHGSDGILARKTVPIGRGHRVEVEGTTGEPCTI